MIRLAGLCSVLLLAGCVTPQVFICQRDSQCGDHARCEGDGYCSFADDDCDSGWRYGEHAGAGVADRCVENDHDDPSGPGDPGDPPLTPRRIVQVVAGSEHSCALDEDGGALCWGRNDNGNLGDGTTEDRDRPEHVTDLPPVAQLAAGELHTCAIDVDGAVWCWGGGDHGQLGDGASVDRDRPVAVIGLDDAVDLAAGEYHTCALRASGAVVCWGRNHRGQLGLGDRDSRPEPVEVSLAASQLAADGHVTCVRHQGGATSCWGNDRKGQLGLGTTADDDSADRLVPTAIPWLDGMAEVEIGGDHVCGLSIAGEVSCAGDNEHGQLGDGSQDRRNLPVRARGVNGAVAVSAGESFTCAVLVERVSCWGRNAAGELGRGEGADQSEARQPVMLGDVRLVDVSAGELHACGLDGDGCVWCWGSNERGQLGGDDGGPPVVRAETGCP